jgi:long-subunit acyl-CoA synthetase (AMP-forming)
VNSFAVDQQRHPRSSLAAGTLAEAFQRTAARCADRPALRTRDGSVRLTWAQYAERVRSVAAGLAALGVTRGQAVAIMLSNRPEFQIVDSAALHLGATPFSIYSSYPPAQVVRLLAAAESRVIVTERAMLPTVLEAARSGGAEHVVVVDGTGEGMTLAELEAGAAPDFDFDAAWRAVNAEDVLTIIFTSGTTGPPKGVELTHANMLATLRAYSEVIGFPRDGRVISWLPMAHIAERACSHYLPIAWGYEATCIADPREAIAALGEVRPTWFFGVPRTWEKLKASVEAAIEAEPDGERRATAWAAIATGLERTRAIQAGRRLPPAVEARYWELDKLVLSPIRRRLGLDEASAINAGAAPTAPEVIEFFHALGLPLAELWGLSESCAAGTVNAPGGIRIGTVGRALPGFELKLDQKGELLLRGPGVMSGYRGEPERTREVLDEDGWLRTGDLARIDADGYVTIVGRSKELIVSAAGENISPATIESALKTSCSLIGHAVAIGDRRPYNVALVTLDPHGARVFASRLGLPTESLEDLAEIRAVRNTVAQGVELANLKLAQMEQVQRFHLLGLDWQPGGDELTPTSKLKRQPIAEKYSREIEALYVS